jgi:predicted alpha/beta hydrolase family esterase
MANMKTALIIHGWPSKEEYFDPATPSPSNNQWLPWLQKQLGLKGITAQTPEMPDAYEPNYEKWKATFEQFHVDEETILVGHSCGGGFLVRWLSENKIKVGPVILVAPWMDVEHEERESIGGFFDFEIDPTLSDRTDGVTIFISNDDDKPMLDTVELLEQTLKGYFTKRFEDKGHFCISDGVAEFPELLEEIVK